MSSNGVGLAEPASSAISSRRFACDRCRGHKLRCLRQNLDQERCDRCARAKVDCFTSPCRKRGRKRRQQLLTQQQAQKHQTLQRSRQDSSMDALIQTSTFDQGDLADKRRTNRAPNGRSDSSVFSSHLHPRPQLGDASSRSATRANPVWFEHWQDWRSQAQPSTAMINADPNQARAAPIVSDSTPSSMITGSTAVPWIQDDNAVMYDLLFPDGLDTPLTPFGGDTDTRERNGQQENVSPTPTFPLLPTPLCSPHGLSLHGISDVQGPVNKAGQSMNVDRSRLSLGREPEDIATFDKDSNLEVYGQRDECKPGCIQRLSNISLKLSAQLSKIEAGPPTVTMKSLISFPDEGSPPGSTPIQKILNGTQDFLDILILLTASSRASAVSPLGDASSAASTCSARDHQRNGHGETNNSESTGNSASSPLDSPPDSAFLDSTGKNTQPGLGNEPHVDTAILLLILTCYVHVIRLYVVVFTHAHTFLRNIASSEDQSLRLLPGLSFSGFPLEPGNLQTLIFIQIVTYLLEKIEKLLGFPPELRLNTRGGHYNGLLSDEEFLKIVGVVIRREELGCSEKGKGGIRVLRRYMKNVKQLLRGYRAS